ncbi:MAG: hypothetical protein AAB262_09730 [Elusimicrobiota bacterium]
MPPVRVRQVNIPVFFLREGKTVVAYSPALDLSSCGENQAAAQRRFSRAVGLFLDELEDMGTMDEVLAGLGWTRMERPRSEWVPPHLLKQTQMRVNLPAHAC